MHPVGLLPFAIDLAFIVLFSIALLNERNKPYESSEANLDSFFTCETLYMTSFALIIAFFIDALLYFLALIQQQVWRQYKRRLILWTMYFKY